jgi:hypothetical protein
MIPNAKYIREMGQADFSQWSEKELAISTMIQDAQWAHMNYMFIDKNLLRQEDIDKLKENGYNVVVGQGEVARIKISW